MDKFKFEFGTGSTTEAILLIAAIVAAVAIPLWPIL